MLAQKQPLIQRVRNSSLVERLCAENLTGLNLTPKLRQCSNTLGRGALYTLSLIHIFRTLVGGEVTDYADMLTEARQIATGRMVKDAESLGADDAIVGMRYASASVMQGAAEVIAYGTAVKFV